MGLITMAMLGSASIQAQTFLTDSYTNTFDLGGNTSSFSGSGSVASWIYWYNTPGGNTPMTCFYGLDADGHTTTSGCLEVDSPFGPTINNQNVFFGTFGNGGGYDFSVRANFLNYSNITFKVMMAPGIPPDTNGDFGNIGVGYIDHSYTYQEFGTFTIPGAASNSWVTMTVPINYTFPNLTDVPGLAFRFDNYNGNYIDFPYTNYIDDLELHISPVPVPPPTLSGKLQKPIVGLNEIATTPGTGGQYNRYQVKTVDDTGYTFYGQNSVTYSWNIRSFPQGTGGNFQQHFFIVNGAPGAFDQAADYNLAQCIFITVEQSDAGVATMNFRYKTNEPAGNGMLFNATSPTNTASNPNGWPIQPVSSLSTAVGALGTWSVTFANNSNVTLTAPDGTTTNFVLDAASAALFADPVTLLLGGQPNNPNGAGLAVVYTSFSAAGCAEPYSEVFTNELTINTNFWADNSSDTNGNILVPPGSAYWLGWSLPDAGFSLQDISNLVGGNIPTNWMDLSPLTIQNNGQRAALLPQSSLPAGNMAYFRLLQRTFSQLQVLLPGETNAPNTATGKGGTPTPVSAGTQVNVVVNAVDSTYHIISSGDTIALTSSDTGASLPGATAMSSGTVTLPIYFTTTGPQTVTATDTTNTNIPPATSSSVTVQ